MEKKTETKKTKAGTSAAKRKTSARKKSVPATEQDFPPIDPKAKERKEKEAKPINDPLVLAEEMPEEVIKDGEAIPVSEEETPEEEEEEPVTSKPIEEKKPAVNESTLATKDLLAIDKNDQMDKMVTKKGDKKQHRSFRRSGKKAKAMPTLDASTQRFQPSLTEGLTDKEIKQRQEQGLTNNNKDTTEKSYTRIIFENVFTFFNMLCFVVAAVLIVFRKYTQCFFLVIALVNMIIGIVQQIRSKMTVAKLKLVTAQNVKVVRNGQSQIIPSEQLVLDDIFVLNTGDQIPTDSFIQEGAIEVNESLLTGESLPIKKTVGEKIFAGSFVVSGSAIVKAERIGQYNYANTIQSKAKEVEKSHSELMRGLDRIIKIISIVIIPLSVALFFTQWFSHSHPENIATYIADGWIRAGEALSKTAGSIISMIPSGMYLLTTVALAVGVMNLAKRNTLVQDLYCIEMLARVNTLCLDKTGTLTDGTMRCSEVLVIDPSYDLKKLVGSYLNSFNESNQTSIAMMAAYPLRSDYHAKVTIPFSSARKYSAVTFFDEGTFIMGAPEFITNTKDKTVTKYIADKESMGFRVIMICHADAEIADGEIHGKISPIAVFALEDHIRKEAPTTIKWFSENGVNIKIISGDNPLTVSEIAKKCNVPHAEKCVSLEGLSINDVDSLAEEYTVFGRVSPEQKAEIIRVLKAKKMTVGMTGDGVNDILAMKQSDCSIAMANGSSAARNVAHLVLLDSNFASLPAVVSEGRRVVNNIQVSSSLYLMKTVFTIIFTVVVLLSSIGTSIPYPFTTNNMLIMESLIIGLPSVFLALQKNDSLIEGHFMGNTLSRAIPAGVIMALVIGINYILRYNTNVFEFSAIDAEIQELSFTSFNVLSMIVVAMGMLAYTCRPFNKYRAALFISIIAGVLMTIFILPVIPVHAPDTIASTKPTIAANYNLGLGLLAFDYHYLNKIMWLFVTIYACATPTMIAVLIDYFNRNKSEPKFLNKLVSSLRNNRFAKGKKSDDQGRKA